MLDSEKLPRDWGKHGGIFCPVCRMEAYRLESPQEGKYLWWHERRAFPCARTYPGEQ